MPHQRSARYQRDWNISPIDAEALVAERELAEYFETTVEAAGNAKLAANWVRNEVLRVLNEEKIGFDAYRVTPAMLGRLIRMVESGAHQELNAQAVVAAGAAASVPDADFTGRRLLAELDALDADRLRALTAASSALGRPDADRRVLSIVERVAS